MSSVIKAWFSWLTSILSAHVLSPLFKFIKNYPTIEGKSNMCAYARKHNISVYNKYTILTLGFSVFFAFRDIGSLLQINHINEFVPEDSRWLLYSLIRIFSVYFIKKFGSQIKSSANKHNIEAQLSIKKKLRIGAVVRIVTNIFLSLDHIFGGTKILVTVSFGWIMGFIDTLMTAIWFIDNVFIKMAALFGFNICYCLLASINHSEFQSRYILHIVMPCVLLCLFTISYDINAKSNFLLKRQLKDQKAVYEKFLERIEDPVIILDSTNLLFSNTAANNTLGKTENEILTKLQKLKLSPLTSLSDDIFLRLTKDECSPIPSSEIKYYLYNEPITKDSIPEKVYMVTIVESTFFSRCKTVSLIFRDITQESEQEEKRFEGRLRNMMLYSLAHELRTPLNFFQDALYLAKTLKHTRDGKVRYENGKGAWNYIRNKINDTMNYAQILSGEFRIHELRFSLKKFIFRFQKLALFLIHDKKEKVRINFEIKDEISDDFVGDKERLEQILFNIVQYSARNTDAGLISLSVFIEKDLIIFEVKDTGHGIPEKNILEILRHSSENSFSGIESPLSESTNVLKFSNFGVSISNMICKKMGGKLEIFSTIEKGSCFRLTLPYKFITKSNTNNPHQNNNSIIDDDILKSSNRIPDEEVKVSLSLFQTHESFSHLKHPSLKSDKKHDFYVLIVDDNDFNRIIVKKMVSKYSDNIEEAENGEVAVKKTQNIASNNSSTLIFMDLDMPVLGGIEATKKIREMKSANRSYIVALTAFASEVERKACFDVGMDQFLCKPLTKDNLEEVISNFLNKYINN